MSAETPITDKEDKATTLTTEKTPDTMPGLLLTPQIEAKKTLDYNIRQFSPHLSTFIQCKRPWNWNKDLRVVIIGAGHSAMIIAWLLVDIGFKVTILAKSWPIKAHEANVVTRKLQPSSQCASGLWVFPPGLTGSNADPENLRKAKLRSLRDYDLLTNIALNKEASSIFGVKVRKSVFFSPGPLPINPPATALIKELYGDGVRGVVQSPNLIWMYRSWINSDSRFVKDAFEHLAPVVDTDKFMMAMMKLLENKAVEFVHENVEGKLADRPTYLLERFNAIAIVNSAGWGSAKLANDTTCSSVWRGFLRIENVKLESALSYPRIPGSDAKGMTIVPRGDGIVLASWFEDFPDNFKGQHQVTHDRFRNMARACGEVFPFLQSGGTDDEYPVTQGRICRREDDNRLERVGLVVHNYGLGELEWSMAYGCALDVVDLVCRIVDEIRLPQSTNGS